MRTQTLEPVVSMESQLDLRDWTSHECCAFRQTEALSKTSSISSWASCCRSCLRGTHSLSKALLFQWCRTCPTSLRCPCRASKPNAAQPPPSLFVSLLGSSSNVSPSQPLDLTANKKKKESVDYYLPLRNARTKPHAQAESKSTTL